MEGWIKLHRAIVDWKYFKNSEVYHLFTTIVMLANHKEGFTKDGTRIFRGQLMTSHKSLSSITGISESKIFRIIEKLKNEKQIEKHASFKNTIITVLNYDSYQSGEELSEELVKSERKAGEERVKTNKNANNNKNNTIGGLRIADCFTPEFFDGVIDEPKKNLPKPISKAKRNLEALDKSPLSFLFKPDDEIQSWLIGKGASMNVQKELLEKHSHHVLAEEVKTAYQWQLEKEPRNAGLFLKTWMRNKEKSAYGTGDGDQKAALEAANELWRRKFGQAPGEAV